MTAEGIAHILRGARSGASWIARCPAHHDAHPSLSIREGADGRVLLHCFAGCSYRAIADALGVRPQAKAITGDATRFHKPERIELARSIWRQSSSAAGTVVERYLRRRGITIPPPPSVRFAIGRHAPSQTGPWAIMIAAAQNLEGELVGIHRTYLTGDGRKAPVEPLKMALGPIRGAAVRLGKVGEILALAEGIETALSVQQAAGLPAWAALGTSNLVRIEMPDCVREVIICADNDVSGAGDKAALAAAVKFTGDGRRVRIARPPSAGMDFNDLLRT